MHYKIRSQASGQSFYLDLQVSEYVSIKKARSNIVTFLGIEEKFDILLGNYVEYEQELLDMALRQAVYRGNEWDSARSDLQVLTRRLVNFLTACRLYRDHLCHDVSTIYGPDSPHLDYLRGAFSREYDASFSFRLMEALRNHVQHRGHALHSIGYPWRREGKEPEYLMSFGVEPYLDINELLGDPYFKKKVQAELESFAGRPVNVTPMVRDYVERLAVVHEELRSRVDKDVKGSEGIIDRLIQRGPAPAHGKFGGLSLIAYDEHGHQCEITHIASMLIERRRNLVRKNSSLQTLASRFVTGICERLSIESRSAPNPDDPPGDQRAEVRGPQVHL